MQQSRVFVGMVLILIFGEVLGLYGYGDDYNELTIARKAVRLTIPFRLIVALILNTNAND